MSRVFSRLCSGLAAVVVGTCSSPIQPCDIDVCELQGISTEQKVDSNSISSDSETVQNYRSVEEDNKKSDTVYVTDNGECYHKSGCRHLMYGSTEIDKQTAEKLKYRPCKHCFK